METLTYQKVNKKALQVYDTMHLFISTDSDETDVQAYSHSQGDWEILKHKSGLLWTISTELLDGKIRQGRGHMVIDNPPLTPYDLWQWATDIGYLPQDL